MGTLSNKDEIEVGDTLYIIHHGKPDIGLVIKHDQNFRDNEWKIYWQNGGTHFFSDRDIEIWIEHHTLKKV